MTCGLSRCLAVVSSLLAPHDWSIQRSASAAALSAVRCMPLLGGLWLQRRIAYIASAKRFTPSMVRNALRAMRRRRRRAFNTRIFQPIGS